MKNFKAKELLKRDNYYYEIEDTICVCCERKVKAHVVFSEYCFHYDICLDCLQYTGEGND